MHFIYKHSTSFSTYRFFPVNDVSVISTVISLIKFQKLVHLLDSQKNNSITQLKIYLQIVKAPWNYCSFHIRLSKAFWWLIILLLVISSWNFHDVCERFLYNQKRNFSWIQQKTKIFPINPDYKNCPHL